MEIKLCGYNVLIDDEDYEKVSKYTWYIKKYDLRKNLIYFRHGLTNTTISLHRYVLGLNNGDGRIVDHINCNTLDNRKCNLRLCTVAQNNMNRRNKINSTNYKGVWYDKKCPLKPWNAKIQINKKVFYLGSHETPELAHAAYCEASKKYHGEFGRTE